MWANCDTHLKLLQNAYSLSLRCNGCQLAEFSSWMLVYLPPEDSYRLSCAKLVTQTFSSVVSHLCFPCRTGARRRLWVRVPNGGLPRSRMNLLWTYRHLRVLLQSWLLLTLRTFSLIVQWHAYWIRKYYYTESLSHSAAPVLSNSSVKWKEFYCQSTHTHKWFSESYAS